MYDNGMSTRSVAIAAWTTVLAGFALIAVHFYGGSPGDPEGWFSAVGFGAPVVGAGTIALVGIRFDEPALCVAAAGAVAVMSVVSIVMFPLLAAAGIIVAGSVNHSFDARALVVPVITCVGLVGVFALLVFHQDPVIWSTPDGGGGSSNIVTTTEATISLMVVIVAVIASVVWAGRSASDLG